MIKNKGIFSNLEGKPISTEIFTVNKVLKLIKRLSKNNKEYQWYKSFILNKNA